MILNEGQLTQTNCPLPSHAFTIQNSPLAFEILSSRLYSDPITAIIRELLSNAYDSHCLVGKENVPIKVQLPDYLNPNFTIRDYGIGLEKDEVLLLYTSFFSSTKSATNDFTGCFGLGSKTPFSYATGFMVNSYKNGYKHKFMMVKKDKLPHVIYAEKDFVNEPNGLEIIIPINENDFGLFKEKFFNYLKYIPEIKTTVDKITAHTPAYSFYPFEGIDDFIQLNFYEGGSRPYLDHWSKFHTLELKQGTNVYAIESLANKLITEQKKNYDILASLSGPYRIVLEVPIGTFKVTPNREMIDSTPKTLAKLGDLLDKVQSRFFRSDFSSTDEDFYRKINRLKLQWFSDQVSVIRDHNYDIVTSGYDSLISVPYVAWCRRYGCLSKLTGYTIEKRNDSILKGISLFIDVPLRYKGSKLTKVIYRLVNYANKFNQYDNIYINYIPVYSSKNNRDAYLDSEERKSYLRFKKSIKEINEQTGVSFIIHYTNLNKFIRQYPNGDKPEIFKKRPAWVNTDVGFLIRKAYVTGREEYTITSINRSKRHYSLESFENEYPINNTLIFYDEQVYEGMDNLPDWYWIIRKLGLQNDNSFKRFIDERTKDHHSFTHLDYIVSVSSRNLKYLEDYVTISVKDLIEYYRNLDIKIYEYRCTNSLVNFAMYFKDLLEFYPKNLKDAINKTTFPRKMELLSKVFNRKPSVLIKERSANKESIIESYKKVNDIILHNPNFSITVLNLDKILSSYKPYLTALDENYKYIPYYYNASWEKHINRKGKLEIAKLILKRNAPCSTSMTETQ